MAIQVGDTVPNVTFRIMGEDGPVPITALDFFASKTVALIGVPGAFTPTCHGNHVPGFIKHLEDLRQRGVDGIAVVAVNDIFVMRAWAKSLGFETCGLDSPIVFLADGNGDFPKALGLEIDRTAVGMGMRSQRYAMLVVDGVIKILNVEDSPGKADVSGAPALLAAIDIWAGKAA